jgi:hypothetical protein
MKICDEDSVLGSSIFREGVKSPTPGAYGVLRDLPKYDEKIWDEDSKLGSSIFREGVKNPTHQLSPNAEPSLRYGRIWGGSAGHEIQRRFE